MVFTPLARQLEPEIMDDPALEEQQHLHALRGLERINKWSRSLQIVWPALAALAPEFYAMGGGLVFPDLTADEFVEQRKTAETEAAERVVSDSITARIINATALASERITGSQTAEQQAAIWAQCWTEGV